MITTFKGFGQPLSTGSSNTPLNSQKSTKSYTESFSPVSGSLYTRIDWLQFICVIDPSQLDNLLQVSFKSFHDDYIVREGTPRFCGKHFDNSGSSVRGGAFAWNLTATGSIQVWVSLPASVLAGVEVRDVIEVMCQLRECYGAKFTRIDICLDDYEKELDPDVMLMSYRQGNYANFQALSVVQAFDKGQYSGFTIYLGAAGSEKRLRFYDKSVESKGELDCYRLELQLRADSANTVVRSITDAAFQMEEHMEVMPQFLASLVVGSVDFVDRVEDDRREKNLDRCERLQWWQSFIDRVGNSMRLSIPRPRKTLENTLDWVNRQVQVTLALIHDVVGERGFNKWIKSHIAKGRKRYNVQHEKLMRIARKEYTEEKHLMITMGITT